MGDIHCSLWPVQTINFQLHMQNVQTHVWIEVGKLNFAQESSTNFTIAERFSFYSPLPPPPPPPPPQLIFCREYTHAEENNWHLDHFCCLRCDIGLGGKQYRAQGGMPYCLKCFEAEFSTMCQVRLRGEDIGLGGRYWSWGQILVLGGRYWSWGADIGLGGQILVWGADIGLGGQILVLGGRYWSWGASRQGLRKGISTTMLLMATNFQTHCIMVLSNGM